MAANKNHKKRKLIVDKKANTPYHLKRRNTNLNGRLSTKIVVIFMILAFIIGPIVGLIVIITG